MEASNNDQLSDTASVNSNKFVFRSPTTSEANCTNLETFDFEAFFAQSHSDLSIPADYVKLRCIDFAAEDYSFIDGAGYTTPFAFEGPGSSRSLKHSDYLVPSGPFATDASTLHPCMCSMDIIISSDPFNPNVYMTPQDADGMAGKNKTTQPGGLEGDYREVGRDRRPGQSPKNTFSKYNEALTRRLNVANRISKTVSKSTRTLNIAQFDPSLFYKPLARRLRSWSAPSSTGTLFEYSAQGELEPGCEFSREQMSDYLTYHPLHMFYGSSPSTKNSGLNLWIQTTPADAGKRYPTSLSSKCRFADCSAPNRSIRNGQFRVAFDEQSVFSELVDPYYSAGYVHLFCFEKIFDFPRLCKRFNIQGDDRKFPEGRNKMAVTRDHPAMLGIVNEFIQSSVPWGDERPEDWYQYSLSLALTRYHIQHQSKMRQRVRDARDGNSIDRHLNNLDVMVELAKAIRERKAGRNKRLRAPRNRRASKTEDD